MNRDRIWNILCWNIRGMNDPLKWPALRNKLEESIASIVCFKETKNLSLTIASSKNLLRVDLINLRLSQQKGRREGC
jgi:exonuclease III